jgi:hypothetical protein
MDLTVFRDSAATLVMASKHTTQHHKVSTGSKGFDYITGTGTATISNDMTTKTVSSIPTLYNSR